MIIGDNSHRTKVIEILAKSFDDNLSVNYIIKQDKRRQVRIKYLMRYCFDICLKGGRIYLSDDEIACALIQWPELKKNSFIDDFLLLMNCIGWENYFKVSKREHLLSSHHPEGLFYYLWFVGVFPEFQNMGIGSKFFEEVLQKCDEQHRPFYLETSVPRNLPWYNGYGFKVYNELDIEYKMYQMIRE